MSRIAWLTDIHLNFLSRPAEAAFLDEIADVRADAFLLGGDIGEAPDVADYLERIAARWERPIYFVLGNHDYYHGSLADVRARIGALCREHDHLTWLPEAGVVALTPRTALVGHGGWGDGRVGDFLASDIMINDYLLIDELANLAPPDRLDVLNRLGDEAAAHLRRTLVEALGRFDELLVLMHVPPLREACWYDGQISDDNWAPHFTCRAAGDVIVELLEQHPHRRATVLCGHTHGGGQCQPLPNLQILTGAAIYRHPALQRVFDVA